MKSYFCFSQRQIWALIALCLLISFVYAISFFIPYMVNTSNVNDPNFENIVQEISNKIIFQNVDNQLYVNNYSTKELNPHLFNPNTIDSLEMVQMGLRPKLIHTICNYRNKGGYYYNKEGFKKMYGLKDEEYQILEPYIKIEENKFSTASPLHIDINSADTTELKKISGIGSKLSIAIVNYRQLLGGYVHKEQLKEIYNISEETYSKIQHAIFVKKVKIKTINLNEATLDEMNKHPYLKGNIAKEIVQLRKKKDYQIEKIEQLREIELINEEIFRKIAPYISIQ